MGLGELEQAIYGYFVIYEVKKMLYATKAWCKNEGKWC